MVDAAPPESRCRSPNGLRFLRFSGVRSIQSRFLAPVPRRAADCCRLLSGDVMNSCVCAPKLSCCWNAGGEESPEATEGLMLSSCVDKSYVRLRVVELREGQKILGQK